MDQIPKWFIGAKLNYAENMLPYTDDRTAIISNNENGFLKSITYSQLYSEVHAFSEALRNLGVGIGDRVAGYLPNIIETAIAMLGATSIGAIWSSASPDFGINGVLERFKQIKPKILITVDCVFYNGKWYNQKSKLEGIIPGLSSVEKVILIKQDHSGSITDDMSLKFPNVATWENVMAPPKNDMLFEQLPFDHPVFILFSSGTTGMKKTRIIIFLIPLKGSRNVSFMVVGECCCNIGKNWLFTQISPKMMFSFIIQL